MHKNRDVTAGTGLQGAQNGEQSNRPRLFQRDPQEAKQTRSHGPGACAVSFFLRRGKYRTCRRTSPSECQARVTSCTEATGLGSAH
jgi:hypothetical protein